MIGLHHQSCPKCLFCHVSQDDRGFVSVKSLLPNAGTPQTQCEDKQRQWEAISVSGRIQPWTINSGPVEDRRQFIICQGSCWAEWIHLKACGHWFLHSWTNPLLSQLGLYSLFYSHVLYSPCDQGLNWVSKNWEVQPAKLNITVTHLAGSRLVTPKEEVVGCAIWQPSLSNKPDFIRSSWWQATGSC